MKGFSKGIGKPVTEEFAKVGYCVLINSLDEHEPKKTPLMKFQMPQMTETG